MNHILSHSIVTLACAGLLAACTSQRNTFEVKNEKYTPDQRSFSLLLKGFPEGTRCAVSQVAGKSGIKGSGKRISIALAGSPSKAKIRCDLPGGELFRPRANEWAFRKSQHSKLREGDIERTEVTLTYSLAPGFPVSIRGNLRQITNRGTFNYTLSAKLG